MSKDDHFSNISLVQWAFLASGFCWRSLYVCHHLRLSAVCLLSLSTTSTSWFVASSFHHDPIGWGQVMCQSSCQPQHLPFICGSKVFICELKATSGNLLSNYFLLMFVPFEKCVKLLKSPQKVPYQESQRSPCVEFHFQPPYQNWACGRYRRNPMKRSNFIWLAISLKSQFFPPWEFFKIFSFSLRGGESPDRAGNSIRQLHAPTNMFMAFNKWWGYVRAMSTMCWWMVENKTGFGEKKGW